jgi:hypothetical protein
MLSLMAREVATSSMLRPWHPKTIRSKELLRDGFVFPFDDLGDRENWRGPFSRRAGESDCRDCGIRSAGVIRRILS